MHHIPVHSLSNTFTVFRLRVWAFKPSSWCTLILVTKQNVLFFNEMMWCLNYFTAYNNNNNGFRFKSAFLINHPTFELSSVWATFRICVYISTKVFSFDQQYRVGEHSVWSLNLFVYKKSYKLRFTQFDKMAAKHFILIAIIISSAVATRKSYFALFHYNLC